MQVSLKIKRINKFNEYILQDVKTNKKHRLILEFYGKVGDLIMVNEKLLDPKSEHYIQSYAFEKLGEIESNLDETDLAGLMSNDKKYVLKRMYG